MKDSATTSLRKKIFRKLLPLIFFLLQNFKIKAETNKQMNGLVKLCSFVDSAFFVEKITLKK
jgi:hypothetical protein